MTTAASACRIAKRTCTCWLRPLFRLGQDQSSLLIFSSDQDEGHASKHSNVQGITSKICWSSRMTPHLRRRSGHCNKTKKLTSDAIKLIRAPLSKIKTVLIVGGGLVGVEIAGKIDLAHFLVKITLLSGGPRMLQCIRLRAR